MLRQRWAGVMARALGEVVSSDGVDGIQLAAPYDSGLEKAMASGVRKVLEGR